MVYRHTELHMPSSNGSLVIAIKQKAHICASTMPFYRLLEIKMHGGWVASNSIIFIPSFMKTGQLIPKLNGHTHTPTHTRARKQAHTHTHKMVTSLANFFNF
jgi:hypothetical protein